MSPITHRWYLTKGARHCFIAIHAESSGRRRVWVAEGEIGQVEQDAHAHIPYYTASRALADTKDVVRQLRDEGYFLTPFQPGGWCPDWFKLGSEEESATIREKLSTFPSKSATRMVRRDAYWNF